MCMYIYIDIEIYTYKKPCYMDDQSKEINFIMADEKCHLWIHNFPIVIAGPCGRKDIIIIFNVHGLASLSKRLLILTFCPMDNDTLPSFRGTRSAIQALTHQWPLFYHQFSHIRKETAPSLTQCKLLGSH